MGAFFKFVSVAILASGLAIVKTNYAELLNPSLSQSSSLEALIDARFKILAIPFQDQIKGLKVQVNRIEADKTVNKNAAHDISKRQVESKKPKTHASVCESSSSLCTFYHPDHPDAKPLLIKEKFKEIPTSCKNLQQLGHKLNGLHLVKTTHPDYGTKIETVFCDFQSSKDVNEVKVGFVDLKSDLIQFHVENTGDRGIADQKFTFQSKENFMNIGNGFDWDNQWFLPIRKFS